ncbi:MAG: hypothetical protein KGJ09_09155 [Candidatus Omnitrophica bacterium]|nr:hypothetical protein [Candidatus Omnitrophota bacterium]
MAALSQKITTPEGRTGLACEPWTRGEIYAVAADWADASSPVIVLGEDGWTHDEQGRQVADFRHSPRAALEAIIREALEMSSDDPDETDVDAILDKAIEISDELNELTED